MQSSIADEAVDAVPDADVAVPDSKHHNISIGHRIFAAIWRLPLWLDAAPDFRSCARMHAGRVAGVAELEEYVDLWGCDDRIRVDARAVDTDSEWHHRSRR